MNLIEFANEHFIGISDALGIAVVDFNKESFDSFAFSSEEIWDENEKIFFDLASITKPLVLALSYLDNPAIFTPEMLLLLNHRAGLPAFGKLDRKTWKAQILSYEIKESDTEYSDFGALRLFHELRGNQTGRYSQVWDKEIVFWKDLESVFVPATGIRNGVPIRGVVNDNNAYIINEFCSHAGLFGTVAGLAQTLLNMNKDLKLLSTMSAELEKKNHDRFCYGFDTASPGGLAGAGHSANTFGHLGFTGTSFWVDAKLGKATIILTNITNLHWYDREKLNRFRKLFGEKVWNES